MLKSIRQWWLVRIFAHLLRTVAIGAIVASIVWLTVFPFLLLFSADEAVSAAVIGLMVGYLVALCYFIRWWPPMTSCGLRKGRRYRVEETFWAGRNCFRAGEVLVFKGERHWSDEESYDEIEREGCDIFEFVDSGSITSHDFPNPSDWTRFLEELSDK